MRIRLFGFGLEVRRLNRPAAVAHVPPPKPDEEASEEFWRAFQVGGTLTAQCACGRTHFCVNTTLDYNPGELETLQELAIYEPGKYIADERSDSVAVMDLPGGLAVWGCPCHTARRYETFVRERRRDIMSYYRFLLLRKGADLERDRRDMDGAE